MLGSLDPILNSFFMLSVTDVAYSEGLKYSDTISEMLFVRDNRMSYLISRKGILQKCEC